MSARSSHRALLLGGTGFIGSHLAAELVRSGHEVVAVDERHYGPGDGRPAAAWRRRELLRGVEVLTHDVLDTAGLAAIVAERRPTAVVHLANLPLAAVAAADPALARTAILKTTESVIAALDGVDTRLVYVSSSMAYGSWAASTMGEDAPLRPTGPYGELKVAAERAVRAARPCAVIVRPSAVYGPGDANQRILDRLVAAARSTRELVVDDPDTPLDFTWVGDLATGLALAATVPAAEGQTFNLTRGVARTLGEAAAVLGVRLRRGPIEHARPRRGALDVARARSVLGYAPRVDLEDGLRALAGA